MNDNTQEPIVKGGQGRTADDVADSAGWIMLLAVVAAFAIAGTIAGVIS